MLRYGSTLRSQDKLGLTEGSPIRSRNNAHGSDATTRYSPRVVEHLLVDLYHLLDVLLLRGDTLERYDVLRDIEGGENHPARLHTHAHKYNGRYTGNQPAHFGNIRELQRKI